MPANALGAVAYGTVGDVNFHTAVSARGCRGIPVATRSSWMLRTIFVWGKIS